MNSTLALSACNEGANSLTERERDVLRAARFGASISDIAAQLARSDGTVANYFGAAMQQTGARHRVDAAHLAEENGWLWPRLCPWSRAGAPSAPRTRLGMRGAPTTTSTSCGRG
jgi:DNA-binding CsgD family transcriptional regulator